MNTYISCLVAVLDVFHTDGFKYISFVGFSVNV